MNQISYHCWYSRQRRIEQHHVNVLAQLMRDGDWLPHDKLDFALLDGKLIIVNGHHRSRAQVQSGVDIQWIVVVHPCKSDQEVAELYYKFDNNQRKRSGANIVQGIGLAEDQDLTKMMASKLYAAAPIIGTRFGQIKRGTEEYAFQYALTDRRLNIVNKFAKDASLFDSIIRLSDDVSVKRKLRTAGILAVAVVSLHYQPQAALEFWEGLARDDGLRKGDPRKSLLVDFGSRNTKQGAIYQGLVACVKAWNAFYRDQDLRQIKVTSRNPIPFAGTPFTIYP